MTNSRTELIEPSKIIIPSSYVPDSDKLDGMANSIQSEGLFHPPLIKENYEIIAGKLRVLGAIKAGVDLIECKVYPMGLEEDEYKALSLHENLKRYNLSWAEQVLAEKELHDLRQSQHGIGRKGAKVGWSIRDTAAELNIAFGGLSEDIKMAEALLADPSLAKIQDKTTAKKVIFRNIKQVVQEMGVTRPVDFTTNVCHHGSAEKVLDAYPDCSFDGCITDPPWLEFKDKNLVKDAFTLDVFKQIYRTLKQNSFLYAFVSTQDWIIYQEEFQKIGFNVQKWPLIWVKEGVLTHGNRSWEYQRDYEPIILAVKGSPALTTNGLLSSVFSCKAVPAVKLTHPNEKPPEVIKRLLEHSSYEGSIILDPFAGSFVVPETCKLMRRRYVAIEKDPKFFIQGEERLKK